MTYSPDQQTSDNNQVDEVEPASSRLRLKKNIPSRHNQNEHYPGQEDNHIRKKRYTFYNREFERLVHLYNSQPLLRTILFYLLYATVAGLVLYFWFNRYLLVPVIQNILQFFQSPLNVVLTILALALSFFRYPLYRSSSTKVEFRPFDLQWKITYAVQIHASNEGLSRLPTLLGNMPYLTFYQLNDFDNESTKLVATAVRRIMPVGIGLSKLRSIVNSILTSTNVVFTPTEIPDIRFQRFHMIKTSKLYLQLDTLTRQLQNNEVSGQLLVVIRKNMDFINNEDLKIDTLYDLYVGFSSSDTDQWIGLMNTISKDLYHRPYLFFWCNRYLPNLWRYMVKCMRFPAISWFVEIRARNKVYMKKIEQAFTFPRFDFHSDQIYGFSAPNIKINYQYNLGKFVRQGVETRNFGIPLDDLATGGIIAGAIGTGKTTLRLHLMQMAIEQGVRVIDFDLKGDATRYKQLVHAGKVVIPNRNFHLNPFNCPKGFKDREYANILLQSFVETIPAGDELSPPQLHLLTRAIYKTVEERGNARSFFKNLYVLGHQEQQFIDNKQENTAQAVITRFNWMQTVMHDIFWQSKSSLLMVDYAQTSLFFDLSQLELTATRPQIRFLINLIMSRVSASMRDRKESKLSDIIFLDETQILMPRRRENAELTKLEQTVTTLRYKGVAVVAAGVSAALMSPVLLDVGFLAQFRSESDTLQRALGVSEENEDHLIAQLPRFHALIRSNSIGSRPVMLKIRKYDGKEVIPDLELPDATPLARFELDFDNIWVARLDAMIMPYIEITAYIQRELRRLASKFVKREFEIFEFKETEIIKMLDHADQRLQKLAEAQALDQVIFRHYQEFLLFVLNYYLLGLVEQFKYDTKLNLIRKNLDGLTHNLIQHVMQLGQHSQSEIFDEELVQLRGAIAQIEEFQHLDREDLNATTVEIAAQLEKLGRQLGIEAIGLSSYILELDEVGWLTPQTKSLLMNFNRKIRNPIVHGSYIYKTTDITLIYRVARVTIDLVESYRSVHRQTQMNFEIKDKNSTGSVGSSDKASSSLSSSEPKSEANGQNTASQPSLSPNSSSSIESSESVRSEGSTNGSSHDLSSRAEDSSRTTSSQQLGSSTSSNRPRDGPETVNPENNQNANNTKNASDSSNSKESKGFRDFSDYTPKYFKNAGQLRSLPRPKTSPNPSTNRSNNSNRSNDFDDSNNSHDPDGSESPKKTKSSSKPPSTLPSPFKTALSAFSSQSEAAPSSSVPTEASSPAFGSSEGAKSQEVPQPPLQPPSRSLMSPDSVRKQGTKPQSMISFGFEQLWTKRLNALILPHVDLPDSDRADLFQYCKRLVYHHYRTYQFDIIKIKAHLDRADQLLDKTGSSSSVADHIKNSRRDCLLLILHSYLYQLLHKSRGKAILKEIENRYIVVIETLIDYIDELTC